MSLRRRVVWAVAIVAVVGGAAGLWAFEPWRLFTSSTIDEPVPVAAVSPAPTSSTLSPVPASSTAPTSSTAPAAVPKELARGSFVTQEHATSGQATVLALPDGSRVLRLTDLATSDGPDLHVWLTDATAGGEWGKYDDGRQVKLGELKATHGNQNYAIPADASLNGLHSVVIWCDRFNVAFGSAPLQL
jgi:Electron transfer DM13